ncbi:MAG: bifunctional hydroxymethylpyrimidine kinase/phosphomethylpyrimidine kinase [Candidatus Solincola sediminis]|uniref:Bifunctional hydroxymethylpyrimidine kinase/phosphomethylpyrimidine kinase n=1 Tax=Candidatus Solincola sediminis TaxID=1797199 RepID=A0A1F2WFU2_9ACTN|nr:MAG: bifunctional hydroxymethylpyrimidine kinase/phosphomethylpyrimidine kinase [Candidatus Solincola sediminis]
MVKLPVVLTIAGSDSGGGAGVQADLKTFFTLGVHGTCAITSITSQNTREVVSRYDLPPDVVLSQLTAVLSDFKVAAAKTGMLANQGIMEAVAEILARHDSKNLVVDPVILSTTGQRLIDTGGIAVLRDRLLPLATVVTPNIGEAQALTGLEIAGLEDMRKAARMLREMGPQAAVVTGGHLGGENAIDIFYDGERMLELGGARVITGDDHGTGCVFSASICSRLALGESILSAVENAKQDVARALENAIQVGKGRGAVQPVCCH